MKSHYECPQPPLKRKASTFQNSTGYCSSVIKSCYPLYKILDQLDFAFILYSMQPLLVNHCNFTTLSLHKSFKNITEA